MTKHCSWNEDLKGQRDQREWERALAKIEEGHEYFKERKYDQAIDCYEEAKIMCPAENKKELSTFFLDGAEAIIDENLKTGDMIIEECNPALEQNELLKVLERLSTTREHNCEMRNALESVTWICLLEGFSNDQPTANAERITKKINKSMTTLDIAVRFVTESIHRNTEDSNKASTLSPISKTTERTSFQGSVSETFVTATNALQSLGHAQFHNYETEEALVDKRYRKMKEEQENKAETDKLEKYGKYLLQKAGGGDHTDFKLEESLAELDAKVIASALSSISKTSEKTSFEACEAAMNVMMRLAQAAVHNYETEEAMVDKRDRKKKGEQENKAETDKLEEPKDTFESLPTDIHGEFKDFQKPKDTFESLPTDIHGEFKDFQKISSNKHGGDANHFLTAEREDKTDVIVVILKQTQQNDENCICNFIYNIPPREIVDSIRQMIEKNCKKEATRVRLFNVEKSGKTLIEIINAIIRDKQHIESFNYSGIN